METSLSLTVSINYDFIQTKSDEYLFVLDDNDGAPAMGRPIVE